MRSYIAIAATVALGLSAAPSFATCTDTLFLQSLTRTEKTYRIKGATIDSSTATKKVPLDSLFLAVPSAVPAFKLWDSVTTLLRFVPDCGSDSVSPALRLRVVDTFATDLMGAVTRKFRTAQEVTNLKAVSVDAHKVLLSSTDTLDIQKSWKLTVPGQTKAAHEVVVLAGEGVARGAATGAVARTFTKNSVNASSFPWSSDLPGKGVANSFDYYLTAFTATNASGPDSVVISLLALEGVYGTTHQDYLATSTGIATARQASSRLGVSSVSEGWKVSGDKAAAGFVRRLDGRLVKTFPAGTSFVWNGRDANGMKAGRGLYLVGLEGQGAATLAVP